MKLEFWKAVIRYGHVGQGNEVSVARYLAFEQGTNIYTVMEEIKTMPGTKNKSIQTIVKITEDDYLDGKLAERDNFYLQDLFNENVG